MAGLQHQFKVLGSVMTSTLTGWRGTSAMQEVNRAAQPLVLFDVEACPYCRAVRETLTALRLDVLIQPCPKGGQRFRPEAQKLAGRLQFPLLVDPNTKTTLLESQAIIDYLFATYGNGSTPSTYRFGPLKTALSGLGSVVRGMQGSQVRPTKTTAQLPLQLWSFESSPYSRLVRERLCELELPYLLHNLGKEQFADIGPARMRVRPGPYRPVPGGPRAAMLASKGQVQVPYLEDPNTGVAMFESADILTYLNRTYAA